VQLGHFQPAGRGFYQKVPVGIQGIFFGSPIQAPNDDPALGDAGYRGNAAEGDAVSIGRFLIGDARQWLDAAAEQRRQDKCQQQKMSFHLSCLQNKQTRP